MDTTPSIEPVTTSSITTEVPIRSGDGLCGKRVSQEEEEEFVGFKVSGGKQLFCNCKTCSSLCFKPCKSWQACGEPLKYLRLQIVSIFSIKPEVLP